MKSSPASNGRRSRWSSSSGGLSSGRRIHVARSMRIGGMTKLEIKGNWNEIKGKLKQKYGQLTDDDLTFVEGREDELLGRMQQRLGKNKEELRREIEGI